MFDILTSFTLSQDLLLYGRSVDLLILFDFLGSLSVVGVTFGFLAAAFVSLNSIYTKRVSIFFPVKLPMILS